MTTRSTVNKADLELTLKEIKISEATSLGYTPAVAPVSILQAIQDAYGLSASDAAPAPFGLRTVDGSLNSLVAGKSDFGTVDMLFPPRLTNPQLILTAVDLLPPPSRQLRHSGQCRRRRSAHHLQSDHRNELNSPAAMAARSRNPLAVAGKM